MAEAEITVKFTLTLQCFCGATFDVAEKGVDGLRDHLANYHAFPIEGVRPKGTDG